MMLASAGGGTHGSGGMAWIYLVLAGGCEVAWAFGLKKYGFRASGGSAATVVGMLMSFWLLSLAMRSLPLGTAYAIWTGIGAVGAAVVGMALLGEPREAGRVVCILLILAGIVGLKASSGGDGGGSGAIDPVPGRTSGSGH
ncbi:MAG: QacE family quaternary ammonium compound efflux transporter [Phycisphaerales bacterium]|nr:QacE family quaternary ammonium compound efflux transporter [Phycisphaerales bacterium]